MRTQINRFTVSLIENSELEYFTKFQKIQNKVGRTQRWNFIQSYFNGRKIDSVNIGMIL